MTPEAVDGFIYMYLAIIIIIIILKKPPLATHPQLWAELHIHVHVSIQEHVLGDEDKHTSSYKSEMNKRCGLTNTTMHITSIVCKLEYDKPSNDLQAVPGIALMMLN